MHPFASLLLGATVLATLLPPPRSSQRLWIVDAAGTGDFMEIQPAVDAAQSGDSIVIRAGCYRDSISVIGKALTITAEGPVAVRTGPILVSLVPDDACFFLAGIEASGRAEPGLWIDTCHGSVHAQDCSFVGGVGELGGAEDGWPGILARSSHDVSLVRCTVRGGSDAGGGATYGNKAGHDWGDASRITIHDSSSTEPRAAMPRYPVEMAATARLQGSFLFASGCRFEGGNGVIRTFPRICGLWW
jgi:hypothetical protein